MSKTIFSVFITTLVLIYGCAAKESGVKKDSKITKSNTKKMMMFQSVSADKATILQKGKNSNYCVICGMTLPMFYKTNHAATVDGKVHQYCSIHCLANEMMQGKNISDIKVVDTNSLKFIDAKKAYYVIGSDKKGTMSPVSKYAFATKEAAVAFAKNNGGKVGTFEDALNAAKKDFSPQMMQKMKNKKMMMAKKGEMIFKQKCKKTDLPKFNSVAEAKGYITHNGICEGLKGKPLQMVGIYLLNR
jgi:nitrous oxide reductase accessory protein NosL